MPLVRNSIEIHNFTSELNHRMKYISIALLLFSGITAAGQITCTIRPSDTIVCFRDSVAFTTFVAGYGPDTVTYYWQKNLTNMPGKTDTVLMIPSVDLGDTAFYRCIVKNGPDSAISNTAHLRMHPKMNFDTLYRYNELGCPGICKGQFKTLVSGGAPPYFYNWGGGHSQDTIVFGLCPGRYWLFVTDTNHCTLDSSYFVDVLKSPKVRFTVLPGDTVYLTNPTITVTFPDTALPYLTNWTWDFRDSVKVPNVNPAQHTYANIGDYAVRLMITDLNGCDTTIVQNVLVKYLNLFIPNVITPNGDGKNDQFLIKEKVAEKNYNVIDLLEVYLSNELIIYDRWGRKVYNQNNYKSGDWDGGNLAEGVYYYIFKGVGQYGNDAFHGSVTILRGNPVTP